MTQTTRLRVPSHLLPCGMGSQPVLSTQEAQARNRCRALPCQELSWLGLPSGKPSSVSIWVYAMVPEGNSKRVG